MELLDNDASQSLSCFKCGYECISPIDLKFHLKCNHNISDDYKIKNDNNIKCMQCGLNFDTNFQLSKHNNKYGIHNIDDFVYCQYCLKTYKHQRTLKAHIKTIHFNEYILLYPNDNEPDKKYNCSECNQLFYTLRNYNDHVKIHLQNNIDTFKSNDGYSCTKCKISFKFKSNLHKHDILCHPIKPSYTCYLCNRKFYSITNIIKHIDTHLKFKCPVCSQIYTNYIDLSTHINLNHVQYLTNETQ